MTASTTQLCRFRSPAQPVHTRTCEVPVGRGAVVDVEIEFWPSSTLFRAGERLRLLVRGSDIQTYPADTFVAGHHLLRNAGRHILHTGGRHDAHVLLPVIPADERLP
jgi:uncharacterized protein